MEIFNEIAPLRAFLKEIRRSGKSIGLVPTMGALHHGHLALIQASKSANTVTVCTIYVNPTQFNNPADLLKYPRDFQKDAEMLEKVGCDAVFYPSDDEMYGTTSLIKFDFGPLNSVMEGKFRPGHFSGVALVVSKLFNIIGPDNAYFGQKDWQQFAIIQQVVRELKFDLHLHSVNTLRERDGLAILATNLRANIDEAFTRRLDAIVDFPAPTPLLRRELWEHCLAPPLPLGDLTIDVPVVLAPMAGVTDKDWLEAVRQHVQLEPAQLH